MVTPQVSDSAVITLRALIQHWINESGYKLSLSQPVLDPDTFKISVPIYMQGYRYDIVAQLRADEPTGRPYLLLIYPGDNRKRIMIESPSFFKQFEDHIKHCKHISDSSKLRL